MIGSDACRHWFWRGWLVALVALAGGNVWAGPEVWVVNTKSKDIAVIDAATDLEIATIPLGDIDGDGTLDPTAPAPGAIDFSTAPGHAGTHAFVTQGRYLRVVEVITWTVTQTLDLEPLLGPGVRLRGVAAARPARFTQGGATPVLRSYLHAAATVDSNTDGNGEPFFVVFDQQELIQPTGAPAFVAQGALDDQPSLDLSALDVTVMGVGGPAGQRAWYSWGELSPSGTPVPAVLITGLVIKGPDLADPWQIVKRRESQLAEGTTAPRRHRLDAPPDREMPVVPLPGEKKLENLINGGRCDLPFSPTAVAVAGPGWDTYTVLAIDENLNQLFRVDSRTCEVEEFPAGDHPVDVRTLGRVSWRKGYVANRGDDSVTVLHEDGITLSIMLSGGGTPCQRCPSSLAPQSTPETSCTVQDLLAVKVGTATELSWTGVGCGEEVSYMVWCSCLKNDLGPCPPECDGPPPLAAATAAMEFPLVGPRGSPGQTTETPWEPLGYTGDTQFTVQGLSDIFLGVTPCENDCPP